MSAPAGRFAAPARRTRPAAFRRGKLTGGRSERELLTEACPRLYSGFGAACPGPRRARGLLKSEAALVLPRPLHPQSTPERFSNREMSILPQGLEQPAPQAARVEERRATVLLAEDDRALRRYLEVVLRRAGYEVLPAADGLEAMKALLSARVDAVVTDAIMPHLSGHELCRFLREHPRLKDLPVVLLSGSDSPAPDEGADLHLSKPVRADELAASLARLLA
jgi:twitching motility two-component system response regulator PilH